MLVKRTELLDWQTYADRRPNILPDILKIKSPRRIHVGPVLTFLFENAATMRYQVQEMMRIERLVRESDIQHELETYNSLLGGPGELGCSLLIELENPEQRAEKLLEWLPLPKHIYAKTADGKKVYADFDAGQIGEDRLSSVQYLKFKLGRSEAVAIGTDFLPLDAETVLAPAQRQALAEDLAASFSD